MNVVGPGKMRNCRMRKVKVKAYNESCVPWLLWTIIMYENATSHIYSWASWKEDGCRRHFKFVLVVTVDYSCRASSERRDYVLVSMITKVKVSQKNDVGVKLICAVLQWFVIGAVIDYAPFGHLLNCYLFLWYTSDDWRADEYRWWHQIAITLLQFELVSGIVVLLVSC